MAGVKWDSAFSYGLFILLFLFSSSSSFVIALRQEEGVCSVPLVTTENRRTVAKTDSGSITAVDIDDGYRGPYHLQFFTLEPQSLLLPLLLHTDMVFYVQTGRGTVSWVEDNETYDLDLETGDIYRIGSGSVVYIRSNPDPMREKLRVYAIFGTQGSEEAYVGAYSNLNDLIRGFDEDILRMGFRVPEEVISELKRVEKPPPIVPIAPKNETDNLPTWKEGIFEALVGGGRPFGPDNGKKKKKKQAKIKTFNIIKAEPDVKNCNGQSISVTDKDFNALKGSDVGVFMVNLTRGSMMGPHWNPLATEIAIVTRGRGMVQVVLPSTSAAGESAPACQSLRFRVNVGDVFLVPRYHPMAQMAFNDDYLAFLGFSTRARRNHPQFLAGKSSVLQTLDKKVLALSLGIPNTTIDQLLAPQEDSVMLECTSCAEEEEKRMEAEIEKQKEAREREEEEARRREEEEASRREEEARKKREEEEEARRREEEEAKKREEEEEARRREEEEEAARRREEEEAKRREEEEAKKREEEEARREEEEARRREEEEEARRQEEERARREEESRRQAEEEEARREEEEEAQRQAEEEEARRREEERPEEEGEGEGGREMFKLQQVWMGLN